MAGGSSSSGGAAKKLLTPMCVDVLHPDFGLGGAEALIRDAVLALEHKKVRTRVFTSHYDPNRCFAETKGMDVRVYGSFLPRHIFQKLHILFATTRAAYCALRAALAAKFSPGGPDVYVCDQISAYVLFLRVLTGRPILFYCHFPDRLLVQNNSRGILGQLKRVYRIPFDAFEEFTTGLADTILVNSNFTSGVFDGAFGRLRRAGVRPKVLYPVCDAAQGQFDPDICLSDSALIDLLQSKDTSNPTFISINRFERKKNIAVAIDALKVLRDTLEKAGDADESGFRSRHVRLVIAGGYDTKVHENVEYHDFLYKLGSRHGFRCYSPVHDGGDAGDFDEFGVPKAAPADAEIIFVPSFTDAQRSCLLAGCLAVLYTPDREHFGIVPLECMAAARPVIAVESGGPMETIVHGETGYLCPPDPLDSSRKDGSESSLAVTMAEHMHSFLKDTDLARDMGTKGRARVLKNFSFSSFEDSLHGHVEELRNAAQDGSLQRRRRGKGVVASLRVFLAVHILAAGMFVYFLTIWCA